jgi:hypothetical protein
MNVELILNKFIENSVTLEIQDKIPYSEYQANLIFSFCHCIGTGVHPKEFENNIGENKIKLKISQGEYCEIKHPLNDLHILHYKLLYHIVYINTYYTTKKIKFNFSNDLRELLDNEDKIINLYEEIKQFSLN